MEAVVRVLTIAANAYREAVRARILHGLLGLAFATCVYATLVGRLSLRDEQRVVADIGSASISLYAALVAVVLGASSLHREIELKTIFPILTRPLRRHEYVLGKYLGILGTLCVFITLDAAAVLAVLAFQSSPKPAVVGIVLALLLAILGVLLLRARFTRVFVIVPWAAAAFVAMFMLSAAAGGERQLVVASAALTVAESAIVTAVATLFASFSSPFLTAVFTCGVFVVGRSADTLGNLPKRYFGELVRQIGMVLARVFPNLQLYVPPRPVLLGHVPDMPTWSFVGSASLHAVAYAAVLLALSALVFERRDFQ